MFVDVIDLREFYASPLGRIASLSLGAAIGRAWPEAPGERLAGLGYCVPWLETYVENSERVLCFMPAAQGAIEWPQAAPSLTALVFGEQLPLADSSLDRLMLVHMLEHAENPADTLSEAWRVLAPGGRLLIVVPNRRGLWARFEHTPFGTGRPYSRGQMARLLRDALLTPVGWSEALNFPPVTRQGLLRLHSGLERIGKRFWPVFAGAIVVEATKRLYQGLPAPARSARRVFVPALVPQGSANIRPRLGE
jgi:SAM-dependent methyltransferase